MSLEISGSRCTVKNVAVHLPKAVAGTGCMNGLPSSWVITYTLHKWLPDLLKYCSVFSQCLIDVGWVELTKCSE